LLLRIRLRLDSTCVHIRNVRNAVELAYVRAGQLRRVRATHAVLACFNRLIPYIMPELPVPQRQALAQNVKAPLVYNKVLVRNWHPWVRLGVHEFLAKPTSPAALRDRLLSIMLRPRPMVKVGKLYVPEPRRLIPPSEVVGELADGLANEPPSQPSGDLPGEMVLAA
jgi:hypothetical protein